MRQTEKKFEKKKRKKKIQTKKFKKNNREKKFQKKKSNKTKLLSNETKELKLTGRDHFGLKCFLFVLSEEYKN